MSTNWDDFTPIEGDEAVDWSAFEPVKAAAPAAPAPAMKPTGSAFKAGRGGSPTRAPVRTPEPEPEPAPSFLDQAPPKDFAESVRRNDAKRATELRAQFASMPIERRMAELEAMASGNDAQARVAKALLSEVRTENQGAQINRLLGQKGAAPKAGVGSGGPKAKPSVAIPEAGEVAFGPLDTNLQPLDDQGRAKAEGEAAAWRDPSIREKRITFDASEAASAERAQQFARDNPVSASLLSGLSNISRGARGFGTYLIDLAHSAATGEDTQTPQSEGQRRLQLMAQELEPEVGRQSMDDAWKKGEFGAWLGTKLLVNTPQIALSLGTALVPGAQGVGLATMGATATGSKYLDTGNKLAAPLSGLVEVVSEKLPLGVTQRAYKALGSLQPVVRGQVLRAVANNAPIILAKTGSVGLVNAIEETAAQLGNNAIDINILGERKSYTDGVGEAAVIGAAMGKGMVAPGAIKALTPVSRERAIANEIDANLGNSQWAVSADAVARESLRGQAADPTLIPSNPLMPAQRPTPKVEEQPDTPLTPEAIAQMGAERAAAQPVVPVDQAEQANVAVPQVPVQPVATTEPVQPNVAPGLNVGVAAVTQGNLAQRAATEVEQAKETVPPQFEGATPEKLQLTNFKSPDEAIIYAANNRLQGTKPVQIEPGRWGLTGGTLSISQEKAATVGEMDVYDEATKADDAAAVVAYNQGVDYRNSKDQKRGEKKATFDADPSPVFRALRGLSRQVFGLQMVSVEGIKGADGVQFVRNGKPVVLVRKGASSAELTVAVAGHEATHGLYRERPDLALKYQTKLESLLRDGVVESRRLYEGTKNKDGSITPASREYALEEVAADVSGSMWLREDFWRKVAELDTDLFRGLRYRFMANMAKMLNALGANKKFANSSMSGEKDRFHLDRLVKDIEAARDITAQLWAENAMGKKLTAAEQKIDAEVDQALGKVRSSQDGDSPPYGRAPNTLMGYPKSKPPKAFGQSKFRHVEYVRVTFDNGDTMAEAMDGLNKPHALERARRNWTDAKVESITAEEAESLDPGIVETVERMRFKAEPRLSRDELAQTTTSQVNSDTEGKSNENAESTGLRAGALYQPAAGRATEGGARDASRVAGDDPRGRTAGGSAAGQQDGARPQQARSDVGADRQGAGSAQALKPLPGAPSVPGFNGPDPRLVAVAESYAKANGITLRRQSSYVEVDEARARRLAQAYADMPHAPNDPKVREAYQNLIRQTEAQYQALVEAGYRFWFIDIDTAAGQEYAKSPWNAMRDIRANRSMGVFPTAEGFGQGEISDNPLESTVTKHRWPLGPKGELQPVTANDLFRAVHDAFGHGLEGAGFRARGEENAWQAHARLFTGSALGALTSETRGQNSYLNYGPSGDANRNASTEDTKFAPQKTGLMPEWTWSEGLASDEGGKSYGTATKGAAAPVEAYHFSKQQRTTVSSWAYGTGLKGAEAQRLAGADKRLRQRISFYVDQGTGIKPESGVGGHAHRVTLNNLYDDASGVIGGSGNDFELAVLKAGYDGYLVRLPGSQSAQAVLLGRHDVPVDHLGTAPVAGSTPLPSVAKPVSRKSGGDLVAEKAPDAAAIRARSAIMSSAPSFRIEFGRARIKAQERDAANRALEEAGSELRFSRDKKWDDAEWGIEPDDGAFARMGDMEKIELGDGDLDMVSLEDKLALQDELDAQMGQAPRERPGVTPMEGKPAEIKAAGLMMEEAMPSLDYQQDGSGYWARAVVDGQNYTFKLTPWGVDDDAWSAIPDQPRGEYGEALRLNNVSEQLARAYNQRAAASIALFTEGYDILGAVDRKQRGRIDKLWADLAQRPEAFEFSTDIPDQQYKPGRFTGASFVARAQEIVDSMLAGSKFQFDIEPAGNLLNLRLRSDPSQEAQIELDDDGRSPRIYLHAIQLNKGSGAGKAFYQVAAKIAKDYGAPVVADPQGLTAVNTYRRTEQMLSSALRNRDSSTVQPGYGQRIYGWKPGKAKAVQAENLIRLALANARNAKEAVPIADQLRYDLATGKFTMAGEDAEARVAEALKRPDVRAMSVSRSTLARAALTFEAMEKDVEIPDELSGPVLYSRDESYTPLEQLAADDYKAAEGREVVISSGDASLRIDAASVLRDIQKRRDAVKQLLDCLA